MPDDHLPRRNPANGAMLPFDGHAYPRGPRRMKRRVLEASAEVGAMCGRPDVPYTGVEGLDRSPAA